jgi:hypothetical protein
MQLIFKKFAAAGEFGQVGPAWQVDFNDSP